MSGKGSRQRKAQVSQQELDRRWNLAFGKKEKTPPNIPSLAAKPYTVNEVYDNTVTFSTTLH